MKIFVVAPSRLLLVLRDRLWRRSNDNPDVDDERDAEVNCFLWLFDEAVVDADVDDTTDSVPSSSSIGSEPNVDEDFDFDTLLRNAVTALPSIALIVFLTINSDRYMKIFQFSTINWIFSYCFVFHLLRETKKLTAIITVHFRNNLLFTP